MQRISPIAQWYRIEWVVSWISLPREFWRMWVPSRMPQLHVASILPRSDAWHNSCVRNKFSYHLRCITGRVTEIMDLTLMELCRVWVLSNIPLLHVCSVSNRSDACSKSYVRNKICNIWEASRWGPIEWPISWMSLSLSVVADMFFILAIPFLLVTFVWFSCSKSPPRGN